MNILLIDPACADSLSPPSLSLGIIASSLDAYGLKISVLDFRMAADCNSTEEFYADELEFLECAKALSIQADLVYIAAEAGNELKPYPIFPIVVKCATAIKSVNNSVDVIVGGALISLAQDHYKINAYKAFSGCIDCTISGSPYDLSSAILSRLISSDNIVEANKIIGPTWSQWKSSRYPRWRSIIFQRGCPFACDFCFEGKIYNKHDKKDVNSLKSMQYAIEHSRYSQGIEHFIIEDSVLMSNPRFDEIVCILASVKAKFTIYARVSEIIKYQSRLNKLKEVGLTSMIVGIETINDNILKTTRKGVVAKQTKDAIKIAESMGIPIQACFILGFPGENIADINNTISFGLSENFSLLRWHIYMPSLSALPDSLYLDKDVGCFDLLKMNVNYPDKIIGNIIESQPISALFEEHLLIRASRYYDERNWYFAKNIGYSGGFNFFELIKLLHNSIGQTNHELNEERMYGHLFE